MTYNDLILLIAKPSSPVDVAGKAFFSSSLSQNDKKLFIEYLLSNKRYYQLSELMTYQTLTQAYSDSDFIKQKSDINSMDSRYFDLLLLICKELQIESVELLPMFFATATAKKDTLLCGFFGSAKTYLLRLAYDDYDVVFDYILKYDTKFNFLDILIKVDKDKTIASLVDLVINGKNISKAEIRVFLRNFKNDVLEEIKQTYSQLKILSREAAVRLLLLFKNDNLVDEYLNEIAQEEKSIVIKRLIKNDLSVGEKNIESVDALDYYFNCMVSGAEFSLDEFIESLKNIDNQTIASGLFFSVYYNNLFSAIVIVDDGKIYDLSNQAIDLRSDAIIKVMHPCEITSKYEYIKNLNIAQPFDQLNRKVYKLDDYKNDDFYSHVKGTIISDRELKRNMKLFGFRVLSKNSGGYSRELGIIKEGVLCVLNISATNLNSLSGKLVSAESVKFYSLQDIIKINGQIYVGDAPIYPIANLSPRMFSEFLYNVYELLGCNCG